ncbi:MAG: methionyl-tRNA formyltransferase [Trueperella sp.]|nr:methionyl-tRNA formyltransferase [Trueperella sp.]
MRIIFAGTPDVAVPSLHQLVAEHEVIGVLTRPPAPVGRKRVLTASAVQQAAQELSLPVLTPRTLKDTAVQQAIAELKPEAIAVVAYGLLVPADALAIPKYGWVNLHFSALPKWRGAAPVQYALAAGETEIGTSVFQITAGLDTGPIFSTQFWSVDAAATADAVLTQLAQSGAAQLSHTLSDIAAGAVPRAQTGAASYAPRLTKDDAAVDFAWEAPRVRSLINAVTPAPGAWAQLRGQRIKLGPVQLTDQEPIPAGEITPDGLVGTGTSPVRLGQVCPAGKPWMDAQSWLRGLSGELKFDPSPSRNSRLGIPWREVHTDVSAN